MNTKHTQGPWTLRRDPCHFDTLSSITGGEEDTERKFLPYPLQVEVGGHAGLSEQEANARLIAAAPEMLAALKALVSATEDTANPNALVAAWHEADAAIAKAEETE